MRALSVAFLIAVLTCGDAALAQQARVTGATITWFGNFTSGKIKTIDDARIATKNRFNEENVVPPTTNSDQILLAPNSAFGFGYTLSGGRPNGVVELKYVYKYPSPGIPGAANGAPKFSDVVTDNYRIGRSDLYIGYRFGSGDSLATLPSGVWTLQLYSGNTLLAEKTFTLSRP